MACDRDGLMKTKVCSKCGEEKDYSDFRKRKASLDGFHTQCKYCTDLTSALHREKNIERSKQLQRIRRLKCVYGITPEQYDILLDKQGGCCAICNKPAEDFKTNLAVDHDHNSGRIRGLLCINCNHRLVGRHRDGQLLRKIADYVEQGTDWYVPKKRRPVKRRFKKTW